MNSLNFYPLINSNLLIILIILSIIVIFIGFRLKAPGNIFKTILLCLIILSMANPTIISENRENIPDTVAVLFKTSIIEKILLKKLIIQLRMNLKK